MSDPAEVFVLVNDDGEVLGVFTDREKIAEHVRAHQDAGLLDRTEPEYLAVAVVPLDASVPQSELPPWFRALDGQPWAWTREDRPDAPPLPPRRLVLWGSIGAPPYMGPTDADRG